ncbi:InlB B-repeat-containing protein [Adlercreutzia murintestinalis]|uniref:InlB B-repeat-containing protein n=1 Tax=Adlercreutzia murintestinalis TaxID=2941325 RepID=UPI00203EB812|nr:InlB B-repeat-containing protein [Adlercreutzia murintestinalis]
MLPDSLANVPVCTFSRCSKLTAIHVESGSTGDLALEGTSFTSRDGILYTHGEHDALVLVAAPAGIGASAKIAAECTIIAEGAFWGNEALRTIVAQGTVEGIEVNPVFDPNARANAQGEGAADERGEGADGTEGDAAQSDTPTAPVPAFMPQVVENATVVSQDNERGTWEAAGFTHFSHPAQPGAISGPAWGNSGLSYTLLDDFTLSVRWQGDAPATTVEIPAQSEIDSVAYSVSTIAEGAFQDQSELTSITIPNSVTTIGAHAFAGCSALADVAVPGSVATLPEGAFKDATALRQVSLNEGVQEIGQQAFAGSAVETMFLPRSMRTVQAEAFASCQNLSALVALGNVATVSTTAIADTNGVSIYVPFNADEDYAWTTGLPTAGNHLLPYGVKVARDVFNLEEGQSADLFAEGGYAYASDQAQLQVSYKGKAVTADASGTVTAKMPGSSTVTASVVFQDRTLASATCTVKVVHAAVEDGEGTESGDGDGDGASTEEGGEDDAEDDQTPPRPDMVSQDVPLETEVKEDPVESEPTEPKRPTMVSQDVTVETIDQVEVAANEDKDPKVPTADIMFNETVLLTKPGDEAAAEADNGAASEAGSEAEGMPETEPTVDDQQKQGVDNQADAMFNTAAPADVMEAVEPTEEEASAGADGITEPVEEDTDLEDGQETETDAEETAQPDASDEVTISDEPVFETPAGSSLRQILTDLPSVFLPGGVPSDEDEIASLVDEGISLFADARASAAKVTLNPNKGYFRYFFVPADNTETTPDSWSFKLAIGEVRTTTGTHSISHFGHADHGGADGHGYFHTTRTNTDGQSFKKAQRWGEINGKSAYCYSVQAFRDGYYFIKWTKSKIGGTKSSGNTTGVSGTLYANWKPNPYQVSFNGNGATSGSMNNQSMTYDIEANLSANAFVRPGYTFLGWSTSSTGSVNYTNQQKVKNLTKVKEQTVSLYAVWQKNPIVTWNANGGSWSDGTSTKTQEFVTGKPVPVYTAPSRAAYTFAGWSTNPNAASGTTSGNMTNSISADVIYYATWKAIEYVITFDSKGGKFTSSLVGWYSNAACSTAATANSGVIYRKFTILTNGISWPTVERDNWTSTGVVYSGDLVSGKGSGVKGFVSGVPALHSGFSGTGWWGNLTVTVPWSAHITVQCSKPALSPSGTNNSNQYLYYYDFSNGTKFFSKNGISGEWGAASLPRLAQTTATQWITSTPSATAYSLNGFYEKDKTTASLRVTSGGYFVQTGDIQGHTTWEARWTAVQYTITVSAENGTFSSSSLSGWYSNSACTTSATTSSKTVYRKFTVEDSSTRTLPTVTRSGGWTFCGWQLTDNLATNCSSKISTSYSGYSKYVAGNPLSTSFKSITGTGWYGNATIRAVWRTTLTIDRSAPSDATGMSNTSKMYLYYYDWPKNGSTDNGDFFSKYSTSGHTITTTASDSTNKLNTSAGSLWLSASSLPSSASYKLKGFYSSSTGGTEKLTSSGNLKATITSLSGATTWYAQWNQTYTITLDPNGGWFRSGSEPEEILYTQDSEDVPFYDIDDSSDSYTPTKSGAVFAGWKMVEYDTTVKYQVYRDSAGKGWYTSANKKRFTKRMWMQPNVAGEYSYGNCTFRAVWKHTVRLSTNAPDEAQQTITGGHTSLDYYTDYGFCSALAPTMSDYSLENLGFSYRWWLNNAWAGSTKAVNVPSDSSERYIFKGFYPKDHNSASEPMIDSSGYLDASGVYTWLEHYGWQDFMQTWEAKWERRTIEIKWDFNTGSAPPGYYYGSFMVGYGSAEAPDCDSGDVNGNRWCYYMPYKLGWDFAGFYLEDILVYDYERRSTSHYGHLQYVSGVNFTMLFDAYRGTKELTSVTLKAKWTRSIKLDMNEGSTANGGTAYYIDVTYGEKLPESLPEYVEKGKGPQDKPTGATWSYWSVCNTKDVLTSGYIEYYDRYGNRLFNEDITSDYAPPSTLYVLWMRTIQIDGNGADGGVNASGQPITLANAIKAMGFTKDGLYSFDRIHTRTGYRLTGYYTAPTGGTKVCDIEGYRASWIDPYKSATTIQSTIYAQWERLEAYIAFDANGGTGAPDRLSGYPGEAISNRTLPTKTPTRDDYNFAGWYTAKEGGSSITQLPATFAEGTTTYYAHWIEKPLSAVTIKVYDDENEFGEGGYLAADDGSLVTERTWNLKPDTGTIASIESVARQGFKLVGWYSEDANGNRTLVSTSGKWAPTRPTGGWPAQLNYAVVFKADTYTVSYRCSECGALNHDAQNPCKHVISIAELPTTFDIYDVIDADPPFGVDAPQMQPYYDFLGWTGTNVTDDQEYAQWIPIDSMGNKTYTINVQPHRYTLRLNSSPGVWNGSAPTGWQLSGTTMSRGYTVEDAPFELPLPQRNGYSFSHWAFSQGSGQGQNVYPGSPQRLDTTFTPSTTAYGSILYDAVWTDDPYQISYVLSDDLGTGTLPEGADNPLAYSAESEDITLPIPSRIGYDFTGWTEEEPSNGGLRVLEGDTPQIDVVIPHGSWGNRQFVAHWRAYEYDVVYDLDEGHWEDPQPDNPQVAVYDQSVTIEKGPKRTGYIFKGWRVIYETLSGPATRDVKPGDVLERANLVIDAGVPAYPDVPINRHASATIEAVWIPNLSVDVVVGSEGVHMGVQLKGGTTREPFETTDGTATLRNRSDGALKVVSVTPNASSDYDALKADALQLFREEGNLARAQFNVRPARGNVATMQVGTFGIADADRSLTLIDDTAYSSPDVDATGPNHARNWMMEAAGSGNEDLRLIYRLDMGTLQPNDIDLSGAAGSQLHVADLVYKVALVLP